MNTLHGTTRLQNALNHARGSRNWAIAFLIMLTLLIGLFGYLAWLLFADFAQSEVGWWQMPVALISAMSALWMACLLPSCVEALHYFNRGVRAVKYATIDVRI